MTCTTTTLKTNQVLCDFSNPEIVVPVGGNIGTPLRFFEELIFSDDGSGEAFKKYIISVPNHRNPLGVMFPSWKTIWYLARVVRETDTLACYKTYGGISKTDGRLKYTNQETFKNARAWTPLKEYDTFLEKFSLLSEISKQDLMHIDMSMRVKRARFSDPSTSITTEEGRSFVFVNYFEKHSKPGDKPAGQFLEVTRTEDPLQAHVLEPQPKYAGPQCHFCHAYGASVKLGFCGGCKNVRYCGKEHQKADWKEHRYHCKKQEKK